LPVVLLSLSCNILNTSLVDELNDL